MRADRLPVPLIWRGCLALAAIALLIREGWASSPLLPDGDEAEQASLGRPVAVAVLHPSPPAYLGIAAHPLFDASRQPWLAPVSQPPAQAALAYKSAPVPPRGYVLVGLVTGQHQRSAMLRDPFGKTVFLTEGQVLTGWAVHRIDAGGVHFQADGSHYDLAIPPARDVAAGRR